MKFLSVVVVFASMLHAITAQNYCNANLCKAGQTHVACNNNGDFAAACGNNVTLIPMTDELRLTVVAKHNTLRNRIARGLVTGFPPASRMAAIQWSADLAKIAEYGVKKCKLQRDVCRNTAQFPYVGQNIARSGWQGTNPAVNQIVKNQIQAWFDENTNSNAAQMASYGPLASGASAAQFAQVVQEKATHVGCAVVRQQTSTLTYQFMYCNYAFALVRNRPVYTTDDFGVGGMACTSGHHTTFQFLCSFSEQYAVDEL